MSFFVRPWHVLLGLCAAVALVLVCTLLWRVPLALAAAAPARAAADIVAAAPGWVDVRDGVRHLGARADGVVREVAVGEGDQVRAGATLVQLDDRPAVLELHVAELELQRVREQRRANAVRCARARQEVARLAPLTARGAEALDVLRQARQAVDDVQSAAALAEVAEQTAVLSVNLAKDHISRLRLRAPLPGEVLHVIARAGESVAAGAPLLWFAPDGPLIVRAELDERLFAQVRPGMQAQVSPEYDDSKSYAARVLRIARAVGPVQDLPQVRAAAKDDRVVECVLELAPAPLLIGQRVLVRIRGGS